MVLSYAQNSEDLYGDESASILSELQIDRIREEISLELEEIIKVEQETKWKLHFDQQRLKLDEEIYELKRKLRRMSENELLYKASSMKCEEKSHSDTDENNSLISALFFTPQMTINSQPNGFRSLFSGLCGGRAHDID